MREKECDSPLYIGVTDNNVSISVISWQQALPTLSLSVTNVTNDVIGEIYFISSRFLSSVIDAFFHLYQAETYSLMASLLSVRRIDECYRQSCFSIEYFKNLTYGCSIAKSLVMFFI